MRALTAPAATKTESRPKAVVASHWHALDSDAVTSLLNVEPRIGLTSSEVIQRQIPYDPNALQRIKSRTAWRVIADQFTSIVIGLFAIVAVISWLLEITLRR